MSALPTKADISWSAQMWLPQILLLRPSTIGPMEGARYQGYEQRQQRVPARHLEYQTSEYLRLFQQRHSRYYSWHVLDMRSEVTLFTKVRAFRIPMPID